jgi:cell division protein FtsB
VANRPGSTRQGAAQRWVLRLGAAISVLVVAWLVFELGRIQAGYNLVDVAVERGSYEDRIETLGEETKSLREQIQLLETHRAIDREAYREIEASLAGLQQKIQEQRDAIGFYRGIISPDDGGRGLRVQELKLTRGKNDREYHLNLVLVQVMQHERSVKGDVEFSLEGAQDGEIVTYTLEQLVAEDEDSNWPFSFRYFQTLDRQLVLPEGFAPEKVHIEVRSKTKSIASVKQSFLWQTGQG